MKPAKNPKNVLITGARSCLGHGRALELVRILPISIAARMR